MDVDTGNDALRTRTAMWNIIGEYHKILTAIVVLEHADLTDTVTYSDKAMNSVEADSGNKLSLVAGDNDDG